MLQIDEYICVTMLNYVENKLKVKQCFKNKTKKEKNLEGKLIEINTILKEIN